MNCVFCHCEKESVVKNDNKPPICPQGKSNRNDKVIAFVCSSCTQRLSQASQSQLETAHSKAIELGFEEKAKALKAFMGEKENYDGEADKVRSDMVRKRSLRPVRPPRQQQRA